MNLSPNIMKIEPSITLAISAKAKAMKADGLDVIALSAGEPDFGTPSHICKAAIDAINDGFTRYTPASGTPELKKAVSKKFSRDNGLEYGVPQIMINCGAKHSVFLAVYAMTGPGDEVIIPAPYWVSYPEMVRAAGGTPVIVKAAMENGLKITPEQLKQAITPKTKLLILNTPSNPTGMTYSEDELKALAEVIIEANIAVISDEIYEKLVYDGTKHVSFASLSAEMYARTVTINGVSKAYCMTGWRIGYSAGPEDVIKAMSALQSQETSNPSSISQKAALAALTGPEDFLGTMVEEYDRRRRYVVERLNAIDGVTCIMPTGGFYVFPDLSSFYGKSCGNRKIDGSFAMSEYLLEEHLIATVPGTGFGSDDNIRISYATSMENLTKALNRLEEGLKALS